MKLQPDILSAVYIAAIALVGIFVWRTAAGALAANESTATFGKAMLSVSA